MCRKCGALSPVSCKCLDSYEEDTSHEMPPVVLEFMQQVADLSNRIAFLQEQIGTINATISLINQNQAIQSDRLTNMSRYLRSESPN